MLIDIYDFSDMLIERKKKYKRKKKKEKEKDILGNCGKKKKGKDTREFFNHSQLLLKKYQVSRQNHLQPWHSSSLLYKPTNSL